MKSGHKCEMSEKGPQGRGGEIIFTSGQLRYKNSLMWMKSGHKEEGRGGENLQFFRFSKSLRKWRKSS